MSDDIRYVHRQFGYGHVTLAYRRNPDAPPELQVAAAWCSPKERNWSRRIGRDIASGRLKKDHWVGLDVGDGDLFVLTIERFVELGKAPSWAVDALRGYRWLWGKEWSRGLHGHGERALVVQSLNRDPVPGQGHAPAQGAE